MTTTINSTVPTALAPDHKAPALVARDLYRFFRAGDEETLALRDVSLDAWAGEVIAVVGPSGSGKSTLLSCLAGLDEPSGGTVWVAGRRMSHQPERVRAGLRAAHVGVLFQADNLFHHLTVADNVRLARSVSGPPPTEPNDELLAALGIQQRADSYAYQLSGGETVRAGLAVALANDPDVVLADEPTGELDGDTEVRLLDLLRQRADSGRAVVIASHSPAVRGIADRLVRLQDGRLVR